MKTSFFPTAAALALLGPALAWGQTPPPPPPYIVAASCMVPVYGEVG